MVEPIKTNYTVNPIAETNLSNIVENLNVDDNEKIKNGLLQGLEMISNNEPNRM